jgi:predicted transcriptional regulator
MNNIKPTESELEILQVLWHQGPQSVRQVNDELNKNRDVGYTTTLKTMQIMAEKGLTDRDTSKRTHIYSATKPQTDTQNFLLGEFLQSAYRGSAKKLVLQALGNHSTTKAELEEIKSLIEELEKDK